MRAHTETDNNRNSNSSFECQNDLEKTMGAGERHLIHGRNSPVFTAKKHMRRRMQVKIIPLDTRLLNINLTNINQVRLNA